MAHPDFSKMSALELLSYSRTLPDEELQKLDNKYNATTYKCIPTTIVGAEGAYLHGADGKRYLDFLSCFGAVNQGHRHPKILEAVKDQMDHVTLSSRAFYGATLSVWCKFVCEFFGYERVLTMNSGVEGAETAVKLSRRWGYSKKGIPENQAKIICVKGNFWGRSIAAVSTSVSKSAYCGYGPFCPGFVIIDYDNIPALRAELEKDASNIAAFMVEPIQGEAGVVVPSVGYLRAAKDLCEKHNVLFVADEVQTGLCRTGRMLCCDYEDVRPDVVILGKALSGGVGPVSAVLADDAVMLAITHGTHGSTFGGSAMGCAAGIAALKVLKDENMSEKAERLGHKFRMELAKVKDELPWLCSIRGKGLMNAIEVTKGKSSAWDICMTLKERGILCKPTHEFTIRLAPPLCITEEEIMQSVKIIQEVLREFKDRF